MKLSPLISDTEELHLSPYSINLDFFSQKLVETKPEQRVIISITHVVKN